MYSSSNLNLQYEDKERRPRKKKKKNSIKFCILKILFDRETTKNRPFYEKKKKKMVEGRALF